eukprot:8223954-Pyramimonas_sp.AAC.1
MADHIGWEVFSVTLPRLGSDPCLGGSSRGIRSAWPWCAVQSLGSGAGARLPARPPAAARGRRRL